MTGVFSRSLGHTPAFGEVMGLLRQVGRRKVVAAARATRSARPAKFCEVLVSCAGSSGQSWVRSRIALAAAGKSPASEQ